MTAQKPNVVLSIKVERELKGQLEARARHEDLDLSKLIRRVLRAFVENHKRRRRTGR